MKQLSSEADQVKGANRTLFTKVPDTLEDPESSIVIRQTCGNFCWEKHEITMKRRLPAGLLMCRGLYGIHQQIE